VISLQGKTKAYWGLQILFLRLIPYHSWMSGKSTNKEEIQQLIPEKPKRQLVVDVHGRTMVVIDFRKEYKNSL
jgi:hypothetical protein